MVGEAKVKVMAILIAMVLLVILIVVGLKSVRYNPETSDEVLGVPPGPSSPQGVPEPH
jgi:hypothetical protein